MTESEKQLRKILAERVAILDGAMGTMIQSYKLDEQAFRGGQFAHHDRDLKGCNDVLCITQPDLVVDIHVQYLFLQSPTTDRLLCAHVLCFLQ